MLSVTIVFKKILNLCISKCTAIKKIAMTYRAVVYQSQ